MKTFLTLAVLSASLILARSHELPIFCYLDNNELKQFVVCVRERFPKEAVALWDVCRDRILPGQDDSTAVKIVCTPEKKGRELATCFDPMIELQKERLGKIVYECFFESQ
ncbi:uncharacterized protein LOC111086034 [Limulus polyphemus]|uniref:Uncharacterized protein LOC111086034 n=1 Tax=Limulus polyphemus TaxID=6850 RepID=A0ABM1SHE2_LIMPO|nr:uncharacterized protein LOC111086034 [Limulus polyphemus]XP_022243047.1 uncharacterized protein LOC111086034 [Limulus polyphemus]